MWNDFSYIAHHASHKEFVKAGQAVWLPFLLLEDALPELPKTEGAHKVLGVKLAAESRDAAACDGFATAATQSALPGVEVDWAEGSTVQLHEAAISEGLQTVLRVRAKKTHSESREGKKW